MGSPPAGRSLVLWEGHSVFAVQRAPQWTDPAYSGVHRCGWGFREQASCNCLKKKAFLPSRWRSPWKLDLMSLMGLLFLVTYYGSNPPHPPKMC